MEKVISLGAIKAKDSGDCRKWTVLEALKETVREIEEGEIEPETLCLLMWVNNKRDNIKSELFQRFSGVTCAEAASMFALGTYNNLKAWGNPDG